MNFNIRVIAGRERRFIRLLFYFVTIFLLSILLTILLCSCSGDAENGSGNDADGDTHLATDITFVLNNGEPNVICDVKDSVPSPNKVGYYLSGWYADRDFTLKMHFDTIEDILNADNLDKFVNGEYKVYAKWEPLRNISGVRFKDRTVIYDGKPHTLEIEGLPNGAEVKYNGKEEYLDAGEYDVSATVSAYGYNDLKIDGKLIIDKAKIDLSDIIFDSKTITWDGDVHSLEIIGELPKGVEVSYENNGKSEVGVYEITAKFDGGNNYENAFKTATLTILAKKYTVTFVEEDRITEIIVEHGEVPVIPVPTEKRGYVAKWSVENFADIHEDTTVYAIYELATYKIEYEANGGDFVDTACFEYTVKDTILLAAADRAYHIFEGWYDNSDFNGEPIAEIAKDSVGDKKFYAKWKEIEYTVRYELNGGINNSQNSNRANGTYVYTVSSNDLELCEPEMMGYTFTGWADENGEIIVTVEAQAPRDITLYAQWEPTKYSITYVLNGGTNSEDNPPDYTMDDDEIVLFDPTREGYIFRGWYDNPDCLGDSITEIYGYVGENIILYAKWEKS